MSQAPASRLPTRGVAAALLLALSCALAACGGRPDDYEGDRAAARPVALPATVAAARPLPVATNAAPAIDEVAELKRQMIALQHEVADLRRLMARSTPSTVQAVAAAPAGAPPPEADPRFDEAARQAAEQAAAQRSAGLESAFRAEAQDARWSRETATAVRTSLAQADAALQTRIRGVECRSHSCRIEIAAGNEGGAEPDMPMLLAGFAGTLPNAAAGQVDQGDGRLATVLYLSR